MTRDSPSMFIPVMPITLQASIDYLHELPNCTRTEMWLEATIRRSFSKCFPFALPTSSCFTSPFRVPWNNMTSPNCWIQPRKCLWSSAHIGKVQNMSQTWKKASHQRGWFPPCVDHMIPRAKWSNRDFGRSSFSRLQLRRHHVVSLAFSDVPPGCQLIRRTTETSARALWLSEVMGKKRKKYPLVTWLAGKSEIFWRTCLMGTSPSNYYYTS